MNRCQKHGMCDSWGKEWGDKKKHFQAEFKGKKMSSFLLTNSHSDC